MKPKLLFALLSAAAVALLICWITLSRRDQVGAVDVETGALFPALDERVNDVGALEVSKGGLSTRLSERSGRWVIESKGGFPAEFENVKKTVMAVRGLRVLEEKTSNPELYSKIGVEDPAAPGSTSALLRLEARDGATLAELIVGTPRYGSKPSVYVRRAGEARSFLCAGELTVEAEPSRWIKADILKVDGARMSGVRITHADGEVLALSKEQPEDLDFAVAGVPEGRELLSAGVGNAIGTALSWVNVEDVRPADQVEFSAAPVAEFHTRDGLVVRVETAEIDGASWARFQASYEEPPAVAGPVEVPAEPTEGTAEPAIEAKPRPRSAEEVRTEVAELQQRLGGWAFKVPSYKAAYFCKRTADLLKAPPQATPLPAPEPDPGAAVEDDAGG